MNLPRIWSLRGALITAFALLMAVGVMRCVEAATWYACPAAAGANSGTSQANCWAHSAVGWGSMASGDTLQIVAGSYVGSAARMNINSTSANYSVTRPLIIEGNNQVFDCDSVNTHCLYIKAAVGLRIQNLTVQEASAAAIRMDGSDGTIGLHDVTFYNVTARDSDGCGFQIDSGADNIFVTNSVGADNYDSASDGGNADGICLGGSGLTGSVTGVVIQDSDFYNNSDDGVDLFQDNASVVVRRNTIHDNGYASGDGRGIAIGPGTGSHLIEGNIIWNNDQFGVHRRDNSGVTTLRNNTFSNNGTVIPCGMNVNFASSVDLNFPTSATRFTDSGVNSEFRAESTPVSSLSVGAQSYTSGTVGALTANQYGYSAPYVYVKNNPGSAVVSAVPTTQSRATNNAIINAGLCVETVTGLSNGSSGNTYDLAITAPQWTGGGKPTFKQGFKPLSTSPLCGAGSAAAGVDTFGRRFGPRPTVGAVMCGLMAQ